jgi:molybdopterin synthase catalytic subunit
MDSNLKLKFGIWEKHTLPLTEIIDDSLQDNGTSIGAMTLFLGIVKAVTPSGNVKNLILEAYEEIILNSFQSIASKIIEEYSISDIRIHHVVGDLSPGDLIMVILVAGEKRNEVIDALKKTIEKVKKEAPLWKKETFLSGDSHWVEYL